MGYVNTGNWSWEFDPPPYDFLAPRNSAPMPAPILPRGLGAARNTVFGVARANQVRPSYLSPLLDRLSGPPAGSRYNPTPMTPRTGLSGCGCGCGGGCKHGAGLGLFESGLDFSQWGISEWGVVAVGGYLALSLVGDLFAVGRGAKRYGARVAKRRAIRQKFKRELAAA